MVQDILQILVFAPMVVALFSLITKLKLKFFWLFSATVNILIFLVFNIFFVRNSIREQVDVALMQTELLTWSSFWSIDYFFAINQSNLLFLWSAGLVFVITIFIGKQELENSAPRLYSLMFLESAILGLYLAGNLFLFCFFAGLSIFPAAFLIGLDTSEGARRFAKRYAVISGVSVFLVLLCFYGFHIKYAASLSSWLDLSFFNQVVDFKKLIFALMLLAFLMKSIVFPFHVYFSGIMESRQIGLLLPILTVTNYGTYAIFRFLLQLLPIQFLEAAPFFLVLGITSLFWGALRLLEDSPLQEKMLKFSQLFNGLILIGFGCANKMGLTGVLMTSLFYHLTFAALIITLEVLKRYQFKVVSFKGLARYPALASCFIYTVLSAFCFPVSFGFYAMLFVFWGLGEAHKNLLLVVLAILAPLMLLGCYRSLFMNTDHADSNTKDKNFRLSYNELFCGIPIAAFLIVVTFYPELVSNFFVSAVMVAIKSLGIA